MINTFHRLKRQRDAGEIDGFTMIEILIVIVVLGILAAVVIFALGGITGKTAQASCAADGGTVSIAKADFSAQNITLFTNVPGGGPSGNVIPTTIGTTAVGTWVAPTSTLTQAQYTANAATEAAIELQMMTSSNSGPYVQSWPSNLGHYAYVLGWTPTLGTLAALTGTTVTPNTWSVQLYIVTGNSYAVGPPITYTTANSALNGSLTTAEVQDATTVGTGALNGFTPNINAPALYPYVGPSSCVNVS